MKLAMGDSTPCSLVSPHAPDWLLIIGRRHLETVLRIYTAHYNRERPHRGLALQPPEPATTTQQQNTGKIERRDRLGGRIHEYHRAAA